MNYPLFLLLFLAIPIAVLALLLRGLDHPAMEVLHQFLGPPLEEQPRVLDRPRVLRLRAQRVDARREAPLDVVLEARPAPFAGDCLVAGPDPEEAVREGHGPARERRR